ncbi:MAG: ATP-binding cassette domain-containing protein, partial [Bacteroidales bacterium]|nr:ATP-binding cassette domain-containing protein [Bacteroidales bacterium]
MIVAKGLCKRYGQLDVLKGVDLTVEKGKVVSVTGASGAGKTTLLQL